MKSLLLCLALGLTFAACQPAAEKAAKTEASTPAATTPTTDASATPANPETKGTTYYCPMKCEGEKTYPTAGKCPKCKMDLTAND